MYKNKKKFFQMTPKNSENGQKAKKCTIMKKVSAIFSPSIDRFERGKDKKVEKIQGTFVISEESISHIEAGSAEKAAKTPHQRKRSNRKRARRPGKSRINEEIAETALYFWRK